MTDHRIPHPTDPRKPPIAQPNTGALAPAKAVPRNITPHIDTTGAHQSSYAQGHRTSTIGTLGGQAMPGTTPPGTTSGVPGLPTPATSRTVGAVPLQSPVPTQAVPAQETPMNNPTVGAAPQRPVQVEPLVIPQYQPIFDRELVSPIPFAIPLEDGDIKEVNFEIPRGVMGPFDVLGLYLMHVVPSTDQAAGDHPLTWTDPDVGVYSDVEGNPTNPPDFIGAREGDRFIYSLEIAGDRPYTFQHSHMNHNLRTIPLPLRVPAGAQGKLTLIRQPCQRYLPGQTVYVLVGLFGRLFHTVTPPFPLSACKNPVHPVSYTTGSLPVPAPQVALGRLGAPVSHELEINEHWPTIFSHLSTAGADHLFMRFSWQVGFMMNEFVPVRVFQYMTAGGWLPAFVLTNGNSRFLIELAQPAVVANQSDATAGVSIEGASYGV